MTGEIISLFDAQPASDPATSQAMTLPAPVGWPRPPDHDALHGLPGAIVAKIALNTEADPVAILTQLLVCCGAMIGRGVELRVHLRAGAADVGLGMALQAALAVERRPKAKKCRVAGRVIGSIRSCSRPEFYESIDPEDGLLNRHVGNLMALAVRAGGGAQADKADDPGRPRGSL